jgi:hypothetical protein
VIGFGVCTGFALAFRYFAIEGARYYIEALRFIQQHNECAAKESLVIRYRRIIWCRVTKGSAAVAFGLSGLLLAMSFALLMNAR